MFSVDLARRELLRRMLAAVGMGLLYPWERRRGSNRYHDADALPLRLTGLFVHKESARMMGLAYLRLRPGEAEIGRLAETICSDAVQRSQLAAADDARLRQWVRSRQMKDFEEGRRVKVNGWIVSLTEARLCALVALI